jgi:hypothetical protein
MFAWQLRLTMQIMHLVTGCLLFLPLTGLIFQRSIPTAFADFPSVQLT